LPPPHPRSFPTRRSSDLPETATKSHVIAAGAPTTLPTSCARSRAIAPARAPAETAEIKLAPTLKTQCSPQRRSPQSGSLPKWNRSEEHTSELQSRENLVC